MEMMPPEDWAGMDYLVTEFHKRFQPLDEGDMVRILAIDPLLTTVSITAAVGGASTAQTNNPHPCPNGTGFQLGQGQFCDVHIRGGARIEATGRILVGQFMKVNAATGSGDPSFVLVTPTARMRCGHRFYSFDGFPVDVPPLPDTPYNGTYVNIVAPSADIDSVLLDGQTLISGLTCLDYTRTDYAPPSDYSWARCRLVDPPAGGQQHVLASQPVDDERVAAYAYGQHPFGAYSYPTGVGF